MIISYILSGLGNQMFQYAAGKSLALHHKTELKLDIDWFSHKEKQQTRREYGLGIFNLPDKIALKEETEKFTKKPPNNIFGRLKVKYDLSLPTYKRTIYEEPHFHFDRHFFDGRKSALIIGYWQSEKYFLPIADLIRQTFTIPVIGKENERLENKIRSTNAISLHVRRGDMVNNPEVARVHGSCDLKYYLEAIQKLSSEIHDPEFFVFSDDSEWCRQNIQIESPTYFIDNNQGNQAWQDMQLMRMCRHHIIANSSFSWWGAWLNPNPDKKVIAPARWFNNNDKNLSDLLPPGWIRI